VLANAAPLFAATAASFTISEGLTAVGVPSATDASLAERFFVLRSNRRGTRPVCQVVGEGRCREASPYPDQ
jgi:hypothetical protein